MMNPQGGGGRRSKDFQDENSHLEKGGMSTLNIAAKQAGFGSDFTYRQAKSVVDNGVPELIEALDKEKISYNRAADIAKLPKGEQLVPKDKQAAWGSRRTDTTQ